MTPVFNLKDAIVEALTTLGGSGTVSEVREYIKSKYGKDWKNIEKVMDDLCIESQSSFFPPEARVLRRMGEGKYALKEAEVNELPEVKVAIERPKSSAGDAVHTTARVALSMIPVVGGAAKEIFNAIVVPPLAKRQAEWLESMAAKLREVEQQIEGFKIENLSSNENFVSIVTYATFLAIRNHQEEKLEALQNAVLNTALSSLVEEDLQHIFLNYIDELTPWHLKVLKFLDCPEEWVKQNKIPISNYTKGGASAVLYDAFPELKKNRDFAKQLIRDLSVRGLASDWDSMNVMTSRYGMFASRTTSIGKQFLEFVTSPLKKD